MAMLEVIGLSKHFGSLKVIKDLSFTVNRGEVFGFLGPNGAGKTTTMRMITHFIPPSKGKVLVDGLEVTGNDLLIRQKIGYLPETTPLYGDMFVDEYLEYVASIRGLKGSYKKQQIAKMLTLCGLDHMKKRSVAHLSKGYRQRVGLAQALIHEPELLILDEPMSGLDPNQIIEIRSLIKEIGKEKTVIYCSHILSEVAATCDRLLILNKGEIVATGTPEEISKKVAHTYDYTIKLLSGNVTEAIQRLKEHPAITEVLQPLSESPATLTIKSTQGNIGGEIFTLAVQQNWILSELTSHKKSLEDTFTSLTKGEK